MVIMDVLGTAISIPESLADLRGNQRFTFLRHICAADLDCYGFLAFLMGVIDTGDIEQLNPQVRDGLMADQRCAALLEHCRVNGNGILQHHRLRFFKDMKETLRLAAVKMRDITKNQYDNLGVPFEHEQSGLLPGAKFGIFTKENQIFTVYKLDTVSSDTMLCCGCRYKTTIYQECTELTFPDFCPHHDREVLRRMLWDLTPEPCEEVLEGYILSGQPLPSCQMCQRKSHTAVLADVCGNGCSFCLNCLDKKKEQYKQMCPNCGTAMRRDKLENIPERIAPKLGELQVNVCSVFACQYCGTATFYPLLFLESPHAFCYWCTACYYQAPSNCRACGGPYSEEETAVLADVSQGDCPFCFSCHTCETTCFLCNSVEKKYKEYFRRQDCGLCRADITTAPCQACNNRIRLKNLQPLDGYQMCKSCFGKYQQPPVSVELPPPDPQPVEEQKEEEMKDQLPDEDMPSAPVVPVLETPGYEELPYGCQKCGSKVNAELYHACVKQEGQCCLWCFTKSMLRQPNKDYCPSCFTPTCKVLNSANPNLEFSLFCEGCKESSNWKHFFYRSRCDEHTICMKCACKRLGETNGINACPQCESSVDSFERKTCTNCGNVSSSFLHAEQTDHFLCWNCALQETSEIAAICICKGRFTDSFREALLIMKGIECNLCKRYRPLYGYRCSCQIKICAECTPDDRKCPKCGVAKSPPEDWMGNQKTNCVGCLDISSALRMQCGHYCHPKCYLKAGGCPYCSTRPADQPVNP